MIGFLFNNKTRVGSFKEETSPFTWHLVWVYNLKIADGSAHFVPITPVRVFSPLKNLKNPIEIKKWRNLNKSRDISPVSILARLGQQLTRKIAQRSPKTHSSIKMLEAAALLPLEDIPECKVARDRAPVRTAWLSNDQTSDLSRSFLTPDQKLAAHFKDFCVCHLPERIHQSEV